MGRAFGISKEQTAKPTAGEKHRLKIWCVHCWAYFDPNHDCNNVHRPLKPEPKLTTG